MAITPTSVTLKGGESCAFKSDVTPVTWTVVPNRGTITDCGVYSAPWTPLVWSSTNVTVEARKDGQPYGTATILLSPGPTWVGTLTLFFISLFVALFWWVWVIWPPPAELPWLEVSPPVVTVPPDGSQMFDTKIWHTRDQGVTWTATGGLITPNGLFTATAPLKPGDRVLITAARSTDHTLTGTALVIIKPVGLAISPGTAFLLGGMSRSLKTAELRTGSGTQASTTTTPASNYTWNISDLDVNLKDGVATAPKRISQFTRVVVTATDTSDSERQAAAVLYLYAENMKGNAGLPMTELSRDRVLIELVMLMGALGALLAASRSLASFVGNKTFEPSWSLYYLLRPLFGAGLAAISFFAYRIGAVTGLKDTEPADPFTAAFVAGIVGLFADTVLQKLKDTIDALLPSRDNRGDKLSPSAAAPSIASAEGSVTSKQMTIKGHGFLPGVSVTLNGQVRPVKFVSPTELEVTLAASDTVGKPKIIVTNPDKQASAEFEGNIQI